MTQTKKSTSMNKAGGTDGTGEIVYNKMYHVSQPKKNLTTKKTTPEYHGHVPGQGGLPTQMSSFMNQCRHILHGGPKRSTAIAAL